MSQQFFKGRIRSPWNTQNILSKLQKRDRLYKPLLKKLYDLCFRNYITKYQYKVSREMYEKNTAFYRDLVNNCQGNTRGQWRIVNTLNGRTVKGGIRWVILDNGEVVESRELISDTINDYFMDIPNELSNGVPTVYPNIHTKCSN